MKPLIFHWLAPWSWLGIAAAVVSAADTGQDSVDFNRDVRPILSQHCFACHGHDEAHREAGLRLDQRDAALAELESGAVAVRPGDVEKSELIRRVTSSDEAERMPPLDGGEPLTGDQVATLTRWVQQGAPYAEHWSFVAPMRPALPDTHDNTWADNPIDRFVLARVQEQNLAPSPPADRYALIRRVSLDLRGLPPTQVEVAAFIGDPRPDAYEALVDRLLADPAFGERWARVWLDLARYADSRGFGSDPLRTNMWRYRNWVIDALNDGMPYDQFTIEQLAGDLLPEPSLQQRIATAMHRNTMTNTEGGTDDEEFRVAAVMDRVDTTLQVWMGLTAGCAKCHDHKYDPLLQRDYYQLYAFFNQSADADRPDEHPTMEVPTEEFHRELQSVNEKIDELKQKLAGLETAASAEVEPVAGEPPEVDATKKLQDEIARLEKSRPQVPTLPVLEELPAEKRRKTYLMVKGNFLSPDTSEELPPGVPAAFHPLPDEPAKNRLGLAQWLVDTENPLTARVGVNRFWAQLFGTGLVETEEDFGTQGEAPSHPLLLDWLATEFAGRPDGDPAWDVKRILRLMVTSATYRQSSRVTDELLERDPRNRLLARSPRFRLDAETLRDQALALSGLLSGKMQGPSVYPYQPAGLWRAAFNGERSWPTSKGEDKFRRGLYTFWRRTVPYPSMATLDAPSREICTVRRIRTNTPLQALVMLNDPVYVEMAQALARRIVRDGGASARDRVRFAIELCLVRPAMPEQVEHLLALHLSELDHFKNNPAAAEQMATEPLGPLPEGAGMDPAELAAWTVVSNVLLNLDGVLTKN